MATTVIKIALNKDVDEVTESIDYDFTGLTPSISISLMLDDDSLLRVITDKDGNASGNVAVDISYAKKLMFMGGFSAEITRGLKTTSGTIIAGNTISVENTFNDDVDEFPTGVEGTWSLNVRYD